MAYSTVCAPANARSMSVVWGIAVAIGLGCLWGIAEVTLGTSLHVDQVPFAGHILILIGICCALSARRLCPLPGVVMAAGVAAASVRLFGPGPFFVMPAVAILLEAALMESCVLFLGNRRVGFAAAGAAAAAYPLLHSFLFKTLFFGLPLTAVYSGVVQHVGATFRLPHLSGPVLLTLWAVLCLVAGGLVGFAVSETLSVNSAKAGRSEPR